MNIKKEQLINIEGRTDIILLKNQSQFFTTGIDQCLKILNVDDLQTTQMHLGHEFFFKCFQISDKDILLIGSKKIAIVQQDKLSDIKPLENYTQTIQNAVVKDNKLYLQFENEVSIFDLESKEQFKIKIEDCSNLKYCENKVYIKQKNTLLQIIQEDESKYIFSTKNLFEYEKGFQDYLVVNDVVYVYQDQTLLKQVKDGVEQILKFEIESKLFRMFLLSKQKFLVSFDNELVLIDYEKRQVLSTQEDIKQVQVVQEKDDDSYVLCTNGKLYQINTQGLFVNQGKRKVLMDQSDIEEEEIKDKEDSKQQEKDFKEEEEKNDKKESVEMKEQSIEQEIENNVEILNEEQSNEQNNIEQEYINNRNNEQFEFAEFCESYPQIQFIPGTCEEKDNKELLKKNIHGEIIKYTFEIKQDIQVVFSDHLVGKYVLSNEKNYSLGDINQNAFVLATQGFTTEENEYEEDQESQIYFREVTRKNEWEIQYDDDFKIKQVLLSNMLVYILSDQDELRVYNYGGIEIFNRDLYGPVICMSAFQHLFSYVYQNSLPLYGRQNLKIEIFDFYEFQIKSEFKLSLTPYTDLTWFGFSDDGILYCQDNKGYIRMCINNQYWIIVYRPIEQRIFWLYGIMDKELIGYRLSVDQKKMNLDRNYNTFKIIPKCKVYTKQNEQNKEQQEIIYKIGDRLNEKQKYENFKHLKHTITNDFNLKILQEKILDYEQQSEIDQQLECKKLEVVRQLITQDDEQGALYQMLQIRQEDLFQAGIELFEQLKYKKLAEQLKEIAQERGIMMNFQQSNIQPQYESLQRSKERDEKMRKYLEENDKKIKSDFFSLERQLQNDKKEQKTVQESVKNNKVNGNKKKVNRVDRNLLNILGKLKNKKIQQLNQLLSG